LRRSDGETFFLCSQVFAGNVYADALALFHEPPYEFSVAFSEKRYVIFRDAVRGSPRVDSYDKICNRFERVMLDIRRVSCDAWNPNSLPPPNVLVARANLSGGDGLAAAQIEFPIRHINWRTSDRRVQVETGPILVDLGTSGVGKASLRRAYVAFNKLDEVHLLIDEERRAVATGRWNRALISRSDVSFLQVVEASY